MLKKFWCSGLFRAVPGLTDTRISRELADNFKTCHQADMEIKVKEIVLSHAKRRNLHTYSTVVKEVIAFQATDKTKRRGNDEWNGKLG